MFSLSPVTSLPTGFMKPPREKTFSNQRTGGATVLYEGRELTASELPMQVAAATNRECVMLKYMCNCSQEGVS